VLIDRNGDFYSVIHAGNVQYYFIYG